MEDAATTVMERCELLATISEEPNLIVRPYGSRAMNEANDLVAGWMRTAGMSTRQDAIGNLIGRYEGSTEGALGGKTLVLGSHLDTVRDAGKYDGILGVMVALACAERMHQRYEHPLFAVEVVASPTRKVTRKACASSRPILAAPSTQASSIRTF